MTRQRFQWTEITPDPYSNKNWPCYLCFPTMLEIGFITGIGMLVYDKHTTNFKFPDGSVHDFIHSVDYEDGRYAILGGQGHGGDETIWFDEKPHIYYPISSDKSFKWYYPPIDIPLPDVADLICNIKEYSKLYPKKHIFEKLFTRSKKHHTFDESLHGFVIDKVIRLIKNWERKFGNLEDYYNKTFYPRRLKEFYEYRKQADKRQAEYDAMTEEEKSKVMA